MSQGRLGVVNQYVGSSVGGVRRVDGCASEHTDSTGLLGQLSDFLESFLKGWGVMLFREVSNMHNGCF